MGNRDLWIATALYFSTMTLAFFGALAKKEAFSWIALCFLGILFFFYIYFGTKKWVEYFRKKVKANWLFSFFPLFFFLLYLLYEFLYQTHLGKNFHWPSQLNFYLIYLGVPFLVVFFLRPSPSHFTWLDLGIMIWLWYPVEFKLLPKLLDLPPSSEYPLRFSFFLVLLSSLYLFLIVRNLEVKYSYHLKRKDFSIYFFSLLAIFITVVPLGLYLHFLQWNPKWPSFLTLLTFLGIFFFTALPEEFLFRGLLLNWLDEKLGKPKWVILPLLLSSLIFGLAHWNNGTPQPNWNYVLLATIAGFFYGLAYLRSGSLVVSALVHASVNTFWGLLFQ